MKKIGLDIGTVRIGVATSDILGIIASAYQVYTRKNLEADAKYMAALAEKLEADGFVLGLPLKMDGTEGQSVQMVREFASKLQEYTKLPIYYQDERLTTVSAERILLEADMRRDKRKNVIDRIAATIILQAYLDKPKKD